MCFRAFLIRLVTGSFWVDIEAILDHQVSDTTLRARRDEWIRAGVFSRLEAEVRAAYDRILGLDLSEVAIDGSLHKALCGGEGTGPNPTDRAKLGWKWSTGVDSNGIPVGWVIAGAIRIDSILLLPTLDAIAANGLLDEIDTLHLDPRLRLSPHPDPARRRRHRRRGHPAARHEDPRSEEAADHPRVALDR